MVRTTHVRIRKDILQQDKQEHPDMSFSDIHIMYRDMYNGIQKAGRFMYGNVWKKK
jgi:hypothetical protein